MTGRLAPGGKKYKLQHHLTIRPFCRQEGKWSELPCGQTIFALRDNPDFCETCKIDPATRAVISWPPRQTNPSLTNLPQANPKDPEESDPNPSTLPSSAPLAPPSCPPYPGFPALGSPNRGTCKYKHNLLPSTRASGPIRVQAPFSLQDLRQIKGDRGKFSHDPDKYIEAIQEPTQVFELSWKDYATPEPGFHDFRERSCSASC